MPRRKKSRICIIAMLILATPLFPHFLTIDSRAETRDVHAPISISGDTELIGQATVDGWPGDGSANSPFIIEHLRINGVNTYNCISISNTQSHIVITDCDLVNGHGYSISMSQCSNIMINDCNLASSNGIYMYSCQSIGMDGNGIDNNSNNGLYIRYSKNIRVLNNSITGNGGSGIYLSQSSMLSIEYNIISSNSQGARFTGYNNNLCSDIDVKRNQCMNNYNGFIYSYCESSQITGNNITGNKYNGIAISDCDSITISRNNIQSNGNTGIEAKSLSSSNIYGNNFINNTIQASDDASNRWDMGFPITGRGNHWSDYSHRYPEGIHFGHVWDIRYVIPGDGSSIDWYPLVNPVVLDWILPIADAGSDRIGNQGDVFFLNGSGSSDDIGITNYTWSYNDSVSHTMYGVTVNHVFERAGTLEVVLNVSDLGSNWAVDTLIVTVNDTENPWLDEDNSPDLSNTSDNYMFNISVSDNIDVDRVYSNWSHGMHGGNDSLVHVGNDTWSLIVSLDNDLNDMKYFLWFNDTSNNIVKEAVQSVSIKDNDSPTLKADNSPNSCTTGDNFTFDVGISDNIAVDEVWINWFHGSFKGNISLTDDGDGSYRGNITLDDFLGDLMYYIWFNDSSNNEMKSSKQIVSVTDNDSPTLNKDVSPKSGTTGDAFVFDLAVSDNVGIDSIFVNWTHGALSGNVSMVSNGDESWNLIINLDEDIENLTYFIWFNDTSNNIIKGPVQSVSVTDNDLPILDVDNSPHSCTTGDSYMFDIIVSDNIIIDGVYANWSHGTLSGNLSLTDNRDGTWSGTITIDNDLGDLSYYIWLNDTSGNTIKGVVHSINVTDNDVPILDADNSLNFGTTGDNFIFDIAISDNIDLSEVWLNWSHGKIGCNTSIMDDLDGTWSHTITLGDGIQDLTYLIWINDTSGNHFESDARTVPIMDNDRPSLISDNSSASCTTGDTFAFLVSYTDNIGVIDVQVGWSYNRVHYCYRSMINTDNNSWEYDITIDQSASLLFYSFAAFDSQGNAMNGSSSPKIVSIRDNDVPEFANPGNGILTTGDIGKFSIDITDNRMVENVVFEFSIDEGQYCSYPVNPENSTGVRWSISICLPCDVISIEYHFTASDSSGNNVVSDSLSRIVLDDDKPYISSDSSLNTGSTGGVFSFKAYALDNIGIADVHSIWVHGSLLGNVSLSGPDQDGFWSGSITLDHNRNNLSYRLFVLDTAGNWNFSSSRHVDIVDDVKPVFIKDLSIGIATTGDMFNVTALFSDNIGIQGVNLSYSFDGLIYKNVSMVRVWKNIWTRNISVSSSSIFLNYSFFVSDMGGNHLSTQSITRGVLDNDAPHAQVDSCRKVERGEMFTFDGRNSRDNIGILNYTWEFVDDGFRILNGLTASHIFNKSGEYRVTLTAMDYSGNSGSCVFKLVVTLDGIDPSVLGTDVSVDFWSRHNASVIRSGVGYVFSDPVVIEVRVLNNENSTQQLRLTAQIDNHFGFHYTDVDAEILKCSSGMLSMDMYIKSQETRIGRFTLDSLNPGAWTINLSFQVLIVVDGKANLIRRDWFNWSVTVVDITPIPAPILNPSPDPVFPSPTPGNINDSESKINHIPDNVNVVDDLTDDDADTKKSGSSVFYYIVGIAIVVIIVLIIFIVKHFLFIRKPEEDEDYGEDVYGNNDEWEDVAEVKEEYAPKWEKSDSDPVKDCQNGAMFEEEIVEFQCPECGSMVSESDPVCPGCGVAFEEEEVEEEIEVVQFECPECGSLVNESDPACPGCGVEFDEEEAEDLLEDVEDLEAELGDLELEEMEEEAVEEWVVEEGIEEEVVEEEIVEEETVEETVEEEAAEEDVFDEAGDEDEGLDDDFDVLLEGLEDEL